VGGGSAETYGVNAGDEFPKDGCLAGVKFIGRAARTVGKNRKADSRDGSERACPVLLQLQRGYDRQVCIPELLQEAMLFQKCYA